MKLLKSNENIAAIKQLFLDAQKRIVIVSPYINIQELDEIKKILMEKKEKGIFIEVHSRKNRDNKGYISESDIENDFKDIKLDGKYVHMDLHTKIYFNEKNAIVTSFNLQKSSLNNIETGYLLENKNKKEFKTLLNDFYLPELIKDEKDIMKHKEMFNLKKSPGVGFKLFRKK